MFRLITSIIYILYLFLPSIVYADSSDENDSLLFGPFISASSTKINDTELNSSSSVTVSRLGGTLYYKFERRSAFSFDVFFHNDSFPASSKNVGKKVNGFGGKTEYLKMIPLGFDYRIWLGGGVGVNSLSYTERFTQYDTGYLKRKYPDRKSTEFNVNLSADLIVKDSTHNYKMLYSLSYEYPIKTGINGLFLTASIIF